MPSTTLNFQFYKWVKARPQLNINFSIIKKLGFSQAELCGILGGMQRQVFLMNKQNLDDNSCDQRHLTAIVESTSSLTCLYCGGS